MVRIYIPGCTWTISGTREEGGAPRGDDQEDEGARGVRGWGKLKNSDKDPNFFRISIKTDSKKLQFCGFVLFWSVSRGKIQLLFLFFFFDQWAYYSCTYEYKYDILEIFCWFWCEFPAISCYPNPFHGVMKRIRVLVNETDLLFCLQNPHGSKVALGILIR